MHRPSSLVLAIAFGLTLAHSVTGATNALDQQFGNGGVVLLGATPVSAQKIASVAGLAIQDDGKIVIGGRFYDSADGAWLAAIGRLTADGSWDTSFGDHGLFVLPFGAAAATHGGEIHHLAVLSDHSVLAAGSAADGSGGYRSCTLLLKLDNTGALSTTFASDQSGAFCYDFAPGALHYSRHWDGLAVGASDTFYLTSTSTNLNHGAIAHFDGNGALVTAWGNNGIANLPVGIFSYLLQLTSNGVLAIGVTGTNSEIDVVRLDASGVPALGYGSNGVFAFDQQSAPGAVSPTQATLDAQQRLLIADNDCDCSGNLPYRFARVTDAGALDPSFNGTSQQPGYPGFAYPFVSGNPNEYVVAVQPLADGHLLATGTTGSTGPHDLALLRLNDDSSYDSAFGDAVHPGWASINVLGTATSVTTPGALAVDSSGRAFITIGAGDGVIGCPGLIRIVADRLFNDPFDSSPSFPTCP